MDSPLVEIHERTVNEILDRFSTENLPLLGERTRVDYERHIRVLRREFGDRVAAQLEPSDLYAFMNVPTGRVQRDRMISVLSAAFSAAVKDWQWLDYNVCSGLQRQKVKSASRIVSDEEISTFRALAKNDVARSMVDLALLTGQLQGDLLKLRWEQVQKAGVLFRNSSTSKTTLVPMSRDLGNLLEDLKRTSGGGEYVLCSRKGVRYTQNGFRAVWQREMRKWVRLGNQAFDFNDLRLTSKQRAPFQPRLDKDPQDEPAAYPSSGTSHAYKDRRAARTALQTCEPYSIDDALKDAFVDPKHFTEILAVLRTKKNIILQGPPGVGKTHLSKRLAFALMGELATDRLEMVQFHQSYSYEDFIQGFRPAGVHFELRNGLFHDFCVAARSAPELRHVFVIDEINRGNLSKVFGEALMLIDADKRGQEWTIRLAYSGEPFFVPKNLYLIGLMNTADRSLAMVDYALRRRFAFVDITPQFESERFRRFLEQKGAAPAMIELVIDRMTTLNLQITDDVANLGSGYCIGHSFFCSFGDGEIPDWTWYQRIIEWDIAPLLREYYFDDRRKAGDLVKDLLHDG